MYMILWAVRKLRNEVQGSDGQKGDVFVMAAVGVRERQPVCALLVSCLFSSLICCALSFRTCFAVRSGGAGRSAAVHGPCHAMGVRARQ